MKDRKTVMSWIEGLTQDDWEVWYSDSEVQETAKAALELLKEQEPIPCGEKIKAGDVVLDFYQCGYCKNAIRKPWKYCPFCGKAVNWNGFDRKALV